MNMSITLFLALYVILISSLAVTARNLPHLVISILLITTMEAIIMRWKRGKKRKGGSC